MGDRTVPRQLLVRAPRGRNKPTSLAYETSVFEWRRDLPPADHLVVVDGLRLQSVPVALINAATEEFRFFELLEQETEPAALAVLGHFFFVYAHPYMDGNGRMGRFLMNAALASGGFPWRVAPLSRRSAYMAALESASTAEDIGPVAEFIASLINTENEGIPAMARAH